MARPRSPRHHEDVNYRRDARPNCQWCNGAFDAEELSFDALGRVTCRNCYDRAASKQADVNEQRARRRIRIGRTLGITAIGSAIGFYIVFFAMPQHQHAKAQREAAVVKRSLADRVVQIEAAAKLPQGAPTASPCDDAAIRARLGGAAVPWSEGTVTDGDVTLQDAASPLLTRIVQNAQYLSIAAPARAEALSALAKLERIGIAVVVVSRPREHLAKENDAEDDRGTVVVVSLATGHASALCWAPLVRNVDTRLRDTRDVQRGAQASLDTITKAIPLERW